MWHAGLISVSDVLGKKGSEISYAGTEEKECRALYGKFVTKDN